MTIVEYLRELDAALRVGPLRKRRIVREIEGHLLDAVHEARIAGAGRQEAERLTIERFGSADELARRFAESSGLGRRRLVAAAVAAGSVAAILGTTLTLTRGTTPRASRSSVVRFDGRSFVAPRGARGFTISFSDSTGGASVTFTVDGGADSFWHLW